MDPGTGCAPRTLAQAGVGQVLLCGHCGQVHLQLGPVTLRLTVEAYGEMASLVESARQRLQALEAGAAAGWPAAVAVPALH